MKDKKNINLEYVIHDSTAHEVAVEIQQNCGNKYSDSERLNDIWRASGTWVRCNCTVPSVKRVTGSWGLAETQMVISLTQA